MKSCKKAIGFLLFLFVFQANAQIKLPSIFGDHMVLQQKQNNPVWGWAKAGETIKVEINGQEHSSIADTKGYWKVTLRPIPAGGPYRMYISGESSRFFYDDIMVGEVWICSGQSNMAWAMKNTNSGQLGILTANNSKIRLITVPRVGIDKAQNDFEGSWQYCSSETVANFSAIGYFFGQNLEAALGVPVGLINNAWGGSAAEAWVNPNLIAKDANYKELMARWKEIEQTFDYKTELKKWEESGKEGRMPVDLLTGNHRPGNIYNGVLYPTIGYGIKGVIWYQGESNATRAYQYRDLFPLMIQNWRDEWKQGDFPFYYVQLADFKEEKETPEESDWAELREAQTMTQAKLANVAEAVIIDLGEGRDIHPRNKKTVADRLSRIALARDYQKDIIYRGPTFQSMEVKDGKAILTFTNVGQGLYAFDQIQAIGFAIAGADKSFQWADAKIISATQIELSHASIKSPVAVRYAWADNPKCNMYNRDGLPMTPFRTDDWEGVTFGKN